SCALCGWTYDWFCCLMILLGIISNGMASLVIGSASLELQGVKSAPMALPGDRMLMDSDDVILLLGKEEDIATTIMRGRFTLRYEPWDEYAAIGLCSLLLVTQLLAQLLLIPQGTFFGQIMFLSSLAALWVYNLYLSSIDNKHIQEELLLEALNLNEQHMRTYSLGMRTTATVFACLMLQPPGVYEELEWKKLGFEPEGIICKFIPNDTPVWTTWREKVLGVMRDQKVCSQDTCYDLLQMSDQEKDMFKPNDQKLLENLLEDACTTYELAVNEKLWLKCG
ncbi:hypothetical protein BDR06DRAFT_883091, partial [Suillus hirtellus]